VAKNDVVTGFPVGILFSEEYNQSVIGGTWNNVHNMEISNSILGGRRITISNPTFAPSASKEHYDIYWIYKTTHVLARDINAFFAPDVVRYNNQQLFAPWQQSNYVPFATRVSGTPAIPSFLIGRSNAQLWASYGMALGATLAPRLQFSGTFSNGTIGP